MEGELKTSISRSGVYPGESLVHVIELMFVPDPYVREDMEDTIRIIAREVVDDIQHEVVLTTHEVVFIAVSSEVAVGIRLASR